MKQRPNITWKERWQRVALVGFGMVVAYAICLIDHYGEEERHLREMYRASVGFGTPLHPVYDAVVSMHREKWKRLFEEELREKVEAADDDRVYIDHEWGIAYAILNGPEREQWDFQPGMDAHTQDEMIRYLSFQVGTALWLRYSVVSDIGCAFEALGTYPDEALARNKGRVERTLRMALEANLNWRPDPAQEFLVSKLSQPWARKLAWEVLSHHDLANRPTVFGSGPTDDFWDRSNLMQMLWRHRQDGNPHAAALLLRFADYDDAHLKAKEAEHESVVRQWRQAIAQKRYLLEGAVARDKEQGES